MNVSDMLALMATLGIGEGTAVDEPNQIALQYLNLAHDQLYRETASLNANLLIKETLNNIANQASITLAQTPFIIANILVQGETKPLAQTSLFDFVQFQSENPYSSTPSIYALQKRLINFYPIQADTVYSFDTWYLPERTPLMQYTLEADIPYPLSYQSVLVDGALYYLFQDESGFKNPQKELEAMKRWNKGRADLLSYLQGVNQLKISTFSNA